MKTVLTILIMFAGIHLFSQTSVITATINVKGNCEECKERIENASDIKGVKKSKWNESTKVLTVVYDSNKTSIEKIEKVIAAAGYETQNQKPNISAYNKLPKCCKYMEGECNDSKK